MYNLIVFYFITVESRAEVRVRGNMHKHNTEQILLNMNIGENIWVKIDFSQSLL